MAYVVACGQLVVYRNVIPSLPKHEACSAQRASRSFGPASAIQQLSRDSRPRRTEEALRLRGYFSYCTSISYNEFDFKSLTTPFTESS